jgi:cellulose 1,4-beta-cellobiosidase
LDTTIDTRYPFKVVTQFHTSGGQLSEIRRFYVQDRIVIPNSVSTTPGITGDSITEQFCNQQYELYGNEYASEPPSFHESGGMAAMTAAMARGMVLAMKLDDRPRSLYFDGHAPREWFAANPGVVRGRCPLDGPDPVDWYPDAHVTFSKFRFGPIGSTYACLGDVTRRCFD